MKDGAVVTRWCRVFSMLLVALTLAPAGGFDEPGKYLNRTAASWAADLSHADTRTRRAAAYALGRLGTAALPHLPTLAQVLARDQQAAVRAAAAATLGELGTLSPGGAVPALTDALEGDMELTVWRAAAEALGKLGDRAGSAQTALTKALKAEDAALRQHAAWALGQLGKAAAPAADDLTTLLHDPEPTVRRNAVTALGHLGADAEESLPAITSCLLDADLSVREATVLALRQIGTRAFASASAILAVAETPGAPATLRKAALVTLEQVWPTGPKADALWERLSRLAEREPVAEVRRQADEAIQKIAPRRRE